MSAVPVAPPMDTGKDSEGGKTVPPKNAAAS